MGPWLVRWKLAPWYAHLPFIVRNGKSVWAGNNRLVRCYIPPLFVQGRVTVGPWLVRWKLTPWYTHLPLIIRDGKCIWSRNYWLARWDWESVGAMNTLHSRGIR